MPDECGSIKLIIRDPFMDISGPGYLCSEDGLV